MDTNEAGREPTEPTDAERFERWWDDEGSGMPPKTGEDTVDFAERVTRIAWLNGAYFAQARVAELEAELAAVKDALGAAADGLSRVESVSHLCEDCYSYETAHAVRQLWHGFDLEYILATPGKEPTSE